VRRCVPPWLLFSVTVGLSSVSCAAETPELDALLKRFVEEFVAITPGKDPFPATFAMGSADGPEEELPVHPVTLSRRFAIAKYEVPQNLYEAVMGRNPSRWKGPRNSVEMITWREAVTFCEKVTDLLRQRKLIGPSEAIRLPTEAEWEYCCRAGTTTSYSFGAESRLPDDPPGKHSILDKYAWSTGNAAGNDPPVGALAANSWGLHDMHGYLWEFTADVWEADYTGAAADGVARKPKADTDRVVIRGGSWKDPADRLRSSSRRPIGQTAADDAVGFRCVLTFDR